MSVHRQAYGVCPNLIIGGSSGLASVPTRCARCAVAQTLLLVAILHGHACPVTEVSFCLRMEELHPNLG